MKDEFWTKFEERNDFERAQDLKEYKRDCTFYMILGFVLGLTFAELGFLLLTLGGVI